MVGGGGSSRNTLLLVLLSFAVVLWVADAAGKNRMTKLPTAYEMLERYGFPRGILPEGEGYELCTDDDAFEVYFLRACEFMLSRTWLVRYDAHVSGAAAASSLTALRRISVKVLFLCLPVSEVDLSGDQRRLYIGPVATSFLLADFADRPRCRGYDGLVVVMEMSELGVILRWPQRQGNSLVAAMRQWLQLQGGASTDSGKSGCGLCEERGRRRLVRRWIGAGEDDAFDLFESVADMRK